MRFLITALSLLTAAVPAFANDGFGGLTATGLTFGQTDKVAMESEDLFIGLDRITVDYVFRNIATSDVTGEVIFPLPPVSLGQLWNMDFNLPDDPGQMDLLNFTITVDGQSVTPGIDRVAVMTTDWWDMQPGAAQYDTPGTDVTATLDRLGIPVTLDLDQVDAALRGLTPEQRKELTDAGLADFTMDGGVVGDILPNWSIMIRYHWTQTFPAGASLKVSHGYDNRPPGGLFGWNHPPTEDYEQELVRQYCIDDGTSKALVKRLQITDPNGETYAMGTAYYIAYVLRTANSWAGPIGRFRLTLDKGAPDNVISLCADGLEKTGPTTFVMEKTTYSPEADLHVLIASPFPPAD